MVTKNEPYNPPRIYLFRDEKKKLGLIKKIKKQIVKFEINPIDVGLSTS